MTTYYNVADIYETIQGEGAQTGTPMLLLRLQGCAVGCPFCDTRETWTLDSEHEVLTLKEALGATPKWLRMTAVSIVEACVALNSRLKWVLLTGGEPAAQDLGELVDRLHEAGFNVALETSGTADGHMKANVDWVCVSPKMNMPGGLEVIEDVVRNADEIKQVVGRERDIERLEQLLEKYPPKRGAVISLQPMSGNRKATDLCIQACLSRGWHLSIQTHKLIDQR